MLCNFCLAASLGELAAIWPTAGGQYHFQWALTTERWRKVMVSLVHISDGVMILTMDRALRLGTSTSLAGSRS